MRKLLNKIKKFLKNFLQPSVTYYYNDQKVDKLPKGVKEHMERTFKYMEETFKHMDEVFKHF